MPPLTLSQDVADEDDEEEDEGDKEDEEEEDDVDDDEGDINDDELLMTLAKKTLRLITIHKGSYLLKY